MLVVVSFPQPPDMTSSAVTSTSSALLWMGRKAEFNIVLLLARPNRLLGFAIGNECWFLSTDTSAPEQLLCNGKLRSGKPLISDENGMFSDHSAH